MSGGRWDYEQSKLTEILERIGGDLSANGCPKTGAALLALEAVLREALYELDLHYSADKEQRDLATYDRVVALKLLNAVLSTEPSRPSP